MVCSARKPWVGGNWKCNGTRASIDQLCKTINKVNVDPNKIDVIVAPAFLHLDFASNLLDKQKFKISTQDISFSGNGAFTGEISIEMAKDSGYCWTLIGHSERRYIDTNERVAKKVLATQKQGHYSAICIGETEAEHVAHLTNTVLTTQLEAIIPSVTDWSKVVIAYEPIWAIGTGLTASPDTAQATHKFIRDFLKQKTGVDTMRIVYGGSVNASNCEQLAKMPDIDGFLVGGASLKPEFTNIVETCYKEFSKS